jgi:3-isopropylmalate dehydrogenase
VARTNGSVSKLFEVAFAQAKQRRRTHGTPGHLTLLDKANVLRSNAFLRKVFDDVAARHPDIGSERLYIDAGSMMFVTNGSSWKIRTRRAQAGKPLSRALMMPPA